MPSQSYQPRILRPIAVTAIVDCADCLQFVVPAYAIWSFDEMDKEKIAGYLCVMCERLRQHEAQRQWNIDRICEHETLCKGTKRLEDVDERAQVAYHECLQMSIDKNKREMV